MTTIELYDATLRDGMQGEGMSLTAAEKVRVVRKLDELGIHLIEAGFPASNPKELELFSLLERERLSHAQVAAFGMTRRRDVAADADPALRVLADCFAPVCTIVGKTWSLHLDKVVRVSRDENLIDIETDKVVLELPAPADGVLVKILKQSKDAVGSGEVIAQIDTEGKAAAASPTS